MTATFSPYTAGLVALFAFLVVTIAAVAILCAVAAAALPRRRGEDSEAEHFAAGADITRDRDSGEPTP